jgi:hypothetical protein
MVFMYIEKAIVETLNLLRLILPIMFVGLMVANVLFSLPQFSRVSLLIAKLTSFANLKSGLAVAAFLAHPVAALSMLAEMYRRKIIDEKEVVIANIIGILPRSIRVIVLFLAPVGFSALGFRAGALYISLIIISRIFIVMGCIVVGRKQLKGGDPVPFDNNAKLGDCLYNALKQFGRIAVMLTLTIFAVMLLFEAGLLDTFNGVAKPLLAAFRLPDSSLLIIATGIPSMVAGIGTAGSLLAKGAIDETSVVLSLLIASIFHSIIECLRNTLPINVSLFGKLLGIKVIISFFLARLVANILAIALLILLRTFVYP